MQTLNLLMCHRLRVYASNKSKCNQQHRLEPDSYGDESNPPTQPNQRHSTQQLVCHKYTCPSTTSNLDRSQDFWLNKVTALDDLGSSVGINGLTVGFEEFRHVEFRSSENLDLSDVDVVQWVDTLDVSGGSSVEQQIRTLVAFSISRPMDSGTNLATNSFNSDPSASRRMISVILPLMALTWED